MSNDDPKTEVKAISLMVPTKEIKTWKALAKLEDRSLSSMIRAAVRAKENYSMAEYRQG